MIKLIKPYIAFDEVSEDFKKVFESGWFTKGPYVGDFRKKIENYTQAKYAFLSTSATTALTMCLKALDVLPNDEVIVSDFSFPATANVVQDIGAKPVFADVELDTYNMSIKDLEGKINQKTKAVIFVDALGNPSGLHEIKNLCKMKNIPLIEDAACAIGSSEKNVKCGNISDLTCFSFHPRKLLTTGEGGAITTNSPQYAEFFDVKLNHGSIYKDGKFDFVDFGYNYRLPDLQCIMGIKQIDKLDSIVKNRNEIRNHYIKELTPLGFIEQKINSDVVYNVQSMVFLVPTGKKRDELIKQLYELGVESTLGTYALSAGSYFKKAYNSVQKNSHFLQQNTITLPCYDGVDVDRVVTAIKKCL